MGALKRHFKGSHIILRTSNWGHMGCSQLSEPLADAAQAIKAVEANGYQCVPPGVPACTVPALW